ncbi:MAG TPA: CoA transferase [Mycobacteriales bacterium]|nr:CoA transferase [Mycobacteriales bacterium]
MSETPFPGPLAGLLVLDLTRVLAGPFAGMMLADLGARVVKVERPGRGDDSRAYGPFVDGHSAYFARVNRGKESIALDLKSAADRDVLLALADRADVLLENFRPGVMDRLGLGADALAERNPRLVYASVSGFGQTGPWRERPAYDTVVQAAAGLIAVTGEPAGEPVKMGTSIADLSAGLYVFGAILAALQGRTTTGRGGRVDVAMFDSALSLLEGAALHYLSRRTEPPRLGNMHHSISPFGTFHCAEAPIVICAGGDGLFGVLCTVVQRPGLVTDPRFADNDSRVRNREELSAELEAALGRSPAADWLERLGAAGVPCSAVSTVGAALDSEQAAVRKMVVTAGGLPMVGNPMKIAPYGEPAQRRPAPALDEHGAAIRAELAVPADRRTTKKPVIP